MSEKQIVTVAIWDHKYGVDVRVFLEPATAYAWRTQIAEEWWDEEFPDEERPSEDEIGEVYFDKMCNGWGDAEYFSAHTATVEGA
jgi:hypothetical protein